MRWSVVVRIREFEKWFLIYTTPQVAVILSKEKIQLQEFRAIVRSVPGLLVDLKQS